MWNPPIALTLEEQQIAARTRKTRKFFVFLREHRHELLDADFQHILAQSYSPEPSGQEPVDAGLLALATLLQAYCHVGDRDAVELTVMDKRWQLVLDCLGAEYPPFSQGTLFNLRMRLIAYNLDKTLLDRTVALAEKTGGFGARQLRAVLDSPPLFGAGRVEDTLNLLGHALRTAVGLAAQELGTSAPAVMAAAGLTLVGHSSLKAALDLDWGEPRARAHALGLVLEEVARWQHWLEQQHTLAAQAPPIKEVMETIAQLITQDTEPDPDGEPGGRRIKPHVAPDRRISLEDKDIRHGRKSSAKTFNGFKEHFAVDLDSKGTREVIVRPANEPEHEVVELLAEELEKAPGLLQLDVDLGYMASPRIAQWAEQGVYIIARPWPQSGPLFTKHDFTLNFARMQVTCPGGQRAPMVPGRQVQFPAAACDACALRAQCTKAMPGQGRSLSIREDEQFQQKLRAKMKTQRGRAALRKRTAVEHTIAHQLAHQGRRARYKGLRKNPFDGRRHAAVSNLQVAAHYEEEHRLAS
jgi:DDE family transposase